MTSTAVEEGAGELPPRPPGFPSSVLALVDRGAPDDDVSYVGALLERALTELAPHCRTITVFPDEEGSGDATLFQRAMFALRLYSAGRHADCVLYNHVGVATAQRSLLARMRRPYAVFVHGAEAWDESIDASRRRALLEARLVIAASEFAASRVAAALPSLANLEVLPLALLPDPDAGAVDGALVGSITPRTVVVAGRMEPGQGNTGYDSLLDAWPTILGRRPDARLALVGRGDDAKRLEAKSNALGLARSIRLTGAVSEATLDAMLTRAGGFARASRAGGSGLGYLRAMRAAVPCIASDDDAGREVVEDGVSGMLVPFDDRDALAQAVITLLGDSVRRRDMGEAGRARYAERFTFDIFRDRLDRMFRQTFAPSSPA